MAGDSRFDAILSLAGRTRQPRTQPLAMRTGGFGGIDGLATWLQAERIAAVVDATHPYAVQISANAVAACRRLALPLATIGRPPWQHVAGDRWIGVASPATAAAALGQAPRRVFLSLGRLELSTFANAPQHRYVARLIEPPGDIDLPPDIELIHARGPFDEDGERELLSARGVEIVVSKNSGGAATYAKIAAARALGLPVVMIDRPRKPSGVDMSDAPAVISWLEGIRGGHRPASGSLRGV